MKVVNLGKIRKETMNFDKDGRKLISFGFKHYSLMLKTLFFSQIGLLAIIAGFAEVPEKVKFGYELGVFFAPVSSSIVIGLLIHFFTTHLDKMMYLINSYRNLESYFEGPRRAVKNIFLSLAEDKSIAKDFDFYSINLNESMDFVLSEKILLNKKVMAYDGIKYWHESTVKGVIIQFYNDMHNRYRFELLDLDPNIKRRYLDLATVFENNIMPSISDKGLVAFDRQIRPIIKILDQANNLLSKDLLFKESMTWYSNPPVYGKKSEVTLKIIL